MLDYIILNFIMTYWFFIILIILGLIIFATLLHSYISSAVKEGVLNALKECKFVDLESDDNNINNETINLKSDNNDEI